MTLEVLLYPPKTWTACNLVDFSGSLDSETDVPHSVFFRFFVFLCQPASVSFEFLPLFVQLRVLVAGLRDLSATEDTLLPRLFFILQCSLSTKVEE